MKENIWLVVTIFVFLSALIGSIFLGYSGYFVVDNSAQEFGQHLIFSGLTFLIYGLAFLMYAPYIIRFPKYIFVPLFVLLFGLTGYFIGLAARFMDFI